MIMIPISILMIEDDDDRAFMENLYREHSLLMFKIAFKIAGSPQTAEDMVSEACLKMIKNLGGLRKINICNSRSYIVSIIRNTCINYVNKRNRQSRYSFFPEDGSVFDNVAHEEEIDDEIIRQAEAEELRCALEELPERERLLLTMKYCDTLPDSEIAQVFGIGTSSVRFYLTKARRALREILEGND